MPNTKTGGTVPDLVQEAERAWEKEQESTNKGKSNWNSIEIKFISNIYPNVIIEYQIYLKFLIQMCSRLQMWCGSRRSIWSLHFLQLQIWTKMRRGFIIISITSSPPPPASSTPPPRSASSASSSLKLTRQEYDRLLSELHKMSDEQEREGEHIQAQVYHRDDEVDEDDEDDEDD